MPSFLAIFFMIIRFSHVLFSPNPGLVSESALEMAPPSSLPHRHSHPVDRTAGIVSGRTIFRADSASTVPQRFSIFLVNFFLASHKLRPLAFAFSFVFALLLFSFFRDFINKK